MIITTQDHLEDFCETLKNQDFITVDTEFLREKTYFPKLCLVQMGGPNKNAAAIDPLATNLDLKPVYELLFNPRILKVFHAGRQDLEIFHKLTGQIVKPFFDTQIAAMVCGHGESIGYDNLVRSLTGKSLDKSSQFTNWALRPLSQRQIDYALGDVTHLVDIYKNLSAELERRGRTSWVMEEEGALTNPATYENDPREAWRRVKIKSPKPKTLAVLRELAAWREELAQRRDIPRPWVMKDETLADMAAQAPKTPEQLKKIRGVSADQADGPTGRTLLDLIEQALASDPATWPQPESKTHLPKNLAAMVDVLRMLLRVQANMHDVAAKMIADTDDLEQLALHDHADIPALKGWRLEVFGREALALKRGEIAIGMKGTDITKFRITADSEAHS
jgi:ribonuclease D